MSLATDAPVCGCLGCHNTATSIISHPKHGRRTVCADCADEHEVVGHV